MLLEPHDLYESRIDNIKYISFLLVGVKKAF